MPYDFPVNTFTAMLDDPSGGWRQKAEALAGGILTVIPTMAESVIKGVYDAPNNANLAGQKWGEASQLKGHDSALAYLEGGQYFLGAFQGLGDAATLGTVSVARPSVPGFAPAGAAEKVGRVNIFITREGIVRGPGEVVEPHLGTISKLDRDALVGFRGSLACGFKSEHKGGV